MNKINLGDIFKRKDFCCVVVEKHPHISYFKVEYNDGKSTWLAEATLLKNYKKGE